MRFCSVPSRISFKYTSRNAVYVAVIIVIVVAVDFILELQNRAQQGFLRFDFDDDNVWTQPWRKHEDGKCREFKTRFVKRRSKLPKVLLLSYGGSGNTWMRMLIEGLTGVFTGDVYFRPMSRGDFYRHFLGSRVHFNDQTTFVIKSHRFNESHNFFRRKLLEIKRIIIVRNPFEAIISNFHLLITHAHDKRAKWEKFLDVEFWHYAAWNANQWFNKYSEWLRHDNILVLHYEQLKLDVEAAIWRLSHFLKVRMDLKRLECALSSSATSKFHRSKTTKLLKFPFPQNLTDHVASKVCALNSLMPLPLSRYRSDLMLKYSDVNVNFSCSSDFNTL